MKTEEQIKAEIVRLRKSKAKLGKEREKASDSDEDKEITHKIINILSYLIALKWVISDDDKIDEL